FLLVVALLAPFFSMAQVQESGGGPGAGKNMLKGFLADEATQQPVAYATVTLFSLPDSAAVTGAVTDDAGAFGLQAMPGEYFLRVQYTSYRTKFVGSVVLAEGGTATDLGVILLAEDANMLEEVVVKAEKSQVQFDLDKKVYNVGKDLVNKGGSAAEVLDNVPSVTVDGDGNVSLRGSESVRILIDGKPSGMVSFGSNGLRNLPANMIDRVEVITNPSARYEAEGMAGIINIVLKKDQQKGVNGSVDLTVGQPDEYGAALNFNFRRNKFNFFTNYGIRYNNSPGSSSQYQEFYSGDTTFITDQTGKRQRAALSNSIRFGSDYYFTPKSILTTAFSWRYNDEDNTNVIDYRDYIDDLSHPVGGSRRTDDETATEPNVEYALTYKKLFQRQGRELIADFRYQDNAETERSNYTEVFFNADGAPSGQPDLLQRSENREGERMIVTQLDYVHPFGANGKFETGYRGSWRNLTNDYLVEELEDDQWQTVNGLSNNVLYTENILAGYAIVGDKVGRWSWQAGLRTEVSDIKTELKQTAEVNDRPTYANLFPSAHLNYELSDNSSLQISYSRRIRRPNFRELNPFAHYSDDRNYWGGNPDLDPEYTGAYEIGHLKRWENGSLGSSVYYRHTTDVIERIRTQLSDTSSITRPVNLAERDDVGFEFTGSYEPFKCWKLNANLNLFHSATNGEYEGQVYDAETFSWFGRTSSRLTLWKKVDLQTTFNYRAPRNTTQGQTKAMYHVDLGASTDILKNNGTLTLSVRDVFNTRRWRGVTEGDNFYAENDFQWRARQVSLTFSYRLNRQKEQARDRDREGGGEE
ncbi:MAG TPA: outer membrane beta-barrel family protein, partial [Saprospiraceae bacterium]|nr:outer membrane beta-barrel family protein [Saprospiraceae bacterium]